MSIQIYVDGSWKPSSPNIAGWAYIIVQKNVIISEGNGNIPCLSRQIDGELYGTLSSLNAIGKLDFTPAKIELFYDYIGIEAWATGRWKAKSQVAKDYVEELNMYTTILKSIQWNKVKSHAGVSEGNDIVDQMAKDGLNK